MKAWLISSLMCSLRRGVLSHGHFCPKDHQQHLELARFYPQIAVACTQIVTTVHGAGEHEGPGPRV